MNNSDWDPQLYRRFAEQRAQPFWDLADLLRPVDRPHFVDLGCGDGELTAELAGRIGARTTIGIDNSPAMLQAAAAHTSPTVTFEHGDLHAWTSSHDVDVVLANASLQWTPDHVDVISRWTGALTESGQLAIQVPDNAHRPTHQIAVELANSPQFIDEFGTSGPPPDPVANNVLPAETYAELLHDLGFAEQHVRVVVYPHVLPTSRHAVDWVRGTMLTRFQKVLPPATYQRFVAEYTDRLVAASRTDEPFFFPFRRILMWAQR